VRLQKSASSFPKPAESLLAVASGEWRAAAYFGRECYRISAINRLRLDTPSLQKME